MTVSPNPSVIDADTLTGEMQPIRRAVLSLGSNLGDRLASLQGAINSLKDTPEVWVTDVSAVYETEPWGAPPHSKDFLNCVVLLDTTLGVRRLLGRALAIEAAFGRERGEANAPRTLDVDLIMVGDRQANDEELVLPHPRAAERAFVLVPWHELEPDAELLGYGRVAELLKQVDATGVRLRTDLDLDVS